MRNVAVNGTKKAQKGGATKPILFSGLVLNIPWKYAWKKVLEPSFQPPVLIHFLGLSKSVLKLMNLKPTASSCSSLLVL